MKEVVFINKNIGRWKSYDEILSHPRKHTADKLSDVFIQLTDDLAYARTYYNGSSSVNYLNTLAFKAHQYIYVNKKDKASRIFTFWKYELPMELRANRRNFWISFTIFIIACLVGALSAANDHTFVRMILGDNYVNMTLENISKGDPMAVYKQANEVDMFLGITINNIRVSFYAFIWGIAFSVITAYILISNGVMLGSFQYFFYDYGYLHASILSIWIHGTLEIFSIIVAASAGMAIGNSFMFPGTFPRLYSLRLGTKRGLKIVVGLVPMFIVAGFLESFVTRHTQSPEPVRWAIILLSLCFIVWYFFIYPERVYRKFENFN